MNRLFVLFVLATATPCIAWAQADVAQAITPTVEYGSNPAAGNTFTHDGVKLYYEIYGAGEPILMVHGNGSSIAAFASQIEYFSKNYTVIAMDSRDHGRSGDSPDALTYEKMTDDLAALIDHLEVGPVNALGWSDGGVEALLLGVRHPAKVKKIATMAANLNPGEDAIYPEFIALAESMFDALARSPEADTPQGRRRLKVSSIMLEQPQIDPKALEAITAPTLVMAGDHDFTRDEHTIEIFHHLPNSQLAIFPNSTHLLPIDDPALFNAAVERFFRTPYVKIDRINDVLKSIEKRRSAQVSHQ